MFIARVTKDLINYMLIYVNNINLFCKDKINVFLCEDFTTCLYKHNIYYFSHLDCKYKK